MKQKLLFSALIFIVSAALFTGCGKELNTPDTGSVSPQDAKQDKENDGNGKEEDNDKNEPGLSVEKNKTTEKDKNQEDVSDMLPAMDSLMLCAREFGYDYSGEDPQFIWSALYYALVNYGGAEGLSETTETELKAPEKLVQEYAAGLFADYQELPEIPESLSGLVRYAPEWDAYFFTLSSRGDIKSEIISSKVNEDGSITAAARLVSAEDASAIAAFHFRIVSNAFAEGIEEPLFLHSIADMTPESEGASGASERTLEGTFLSFADGHTIEVNVNGAAAAFQVYDEKILQQLKGMEEGTALLFTVMTDGNTGSSEITGISEK